jgi:hypothetical protein
MAAAHSRKRATPRNTLGSAWAARRIQEGRARERPNARRRAGQAREGTRRSSMPPRPHEPSRGHRRPRRVGTSPAPQSGQVERASAMKRARPGEVLTFLREAVWKTRVGPAQGPCSRMVADRSGPDARGSPDGERDGENAEGGFHDAAASAGAQPGTAKARPRGDEAGGASGTDESHGLRLKTPRWALKHCDMEGDVDGTGGLVSDKCRREVDPSDEAPSGTGPGAWRAVPAFG